MTAQNSWYPDDLTPSEQALLRHCTLCPRQCGVNRLAGQKGFCRATGTQVRIARAGAHLWEEPCISGETGSGTVFFGGCTLGCVYCQNREISRDCVGKPYSIPELAQIFLSLQAKGLANLNLVTPTHMALHIAAALRIARANGLQIPVIYNTSGYESVATLQQLSGLVDAYLPDFKYWNGETSARHCHAPNYPEVARAAIAEMVRQTGDIAFDQNGMLLRGVIVRHLLLPHGVSEAKHILRYLYETYKDRIYLSIMNQYTPPPELCDPVLGHCVSPSVYDALIDWAAALGITNAFIQEGGTVSESFIPKWELE